MGAVVDHQNGRSVGRLGGEPGHPADRAPVDGGIGDDDVVEAAFGEPQRLGHSERQHAAKAGIELADPAQDVG